MKIKDVLLKYVCKLVAKVSGAGEHFLRERIKFAHKKNDGLYSIKQILTDISANSNLNNLVKETLLFLDRDIVMSEDKINAELVQLIENYSSRVGVHCPNATLWSYLHDMATTQIANVEYDELAQAFLNFNFGGMYFTYFFPISINPLDTSMGKAFAQKIVESCEEVSAHVIALISFHFDKTETEKKYIKQLAEMMCHHTLEYIDNGLAAPLWLQMRLKNGEWPGEGTSFIIRRIDDRDLLMIKLDVYLHAIQQSLQEMKTGKTDDIYGKIVSLASKTWGKQTSERLRKIYESAQPF